MGPPHSLLRLLTSAITEAAITSQQTSSHCNHSCYANYPQVTKTASVTTVIQFLSVTNVTISPLVFIFPLSLQYPSLPSHYITLHCITLHYIALHCIKLHYITLHCITLHYIPC